MERQLKKGNENTQRKRAVLQHAGRMQVNTPDKMLIGLSKDRWAGN